MLYAAPGRNGAFTPATGIQVISKVAEISLDINVYLIDCSPVNLTSHNSKFRVYRACISLNPILDSRLSKCMTGPKLTFLGYRTFFKTFIGRLLSKTVQLMKCGQFLDDQVHHAIHSQKAPTLESLLC